MRRWAVVPGKNGPYERAPGGGEWASGCRLRPRDTGSARRPRRRLSKGRRRHISIAGYSLCLCGLGTQCLSPDIYIPKYEICIVLLTCLHYWFATTVVVCNRGIVAVIGSIRARSAYPRPGTTKRKQRRKELSREERALCRFLLDHDVPRARIAGELGYSERTVQRLQKKETHSSDDKSEDAKYIGSQAHEILHRLQKTTRQNATQDSSSPSSSGVCRCKQTYEELDGQKEDKCTRRARSPTPVHAYPGNKSPFGTYLFTVLARFSQEKAFLSDFEDVTFTNGMLVEYGKLSRDELRSALAERFPAMSVINRFILEDALWVWMRAVEVVRREERGSLRSTNQLEKAR
ncbi:hypothetical protein C8R43DRAFT_1159372 [Mycena crocata]|nr:hypothetical protein C8R43DRAFT_1159372 [Mycena crocata]